ncbi:transposase [Paenibacillus sp. GP183]|uniref:transposase n=1 Tax=Paenibacillus sp. GP183 TaxID=1882751 RepID=UPI00089B58BD|nr:transposase [Paenibacillus sp. GP183]SEC56817.1 Transposase zinc-ribbon domain-containing protein [Paenibacillus sp. GP183]
MDGFLLAHFPVSCSTEAECEDYLIQLRWADGFHCPRCDHEFFYKIEIRKVYECRECRTQVSVTAGTVMHRSKLSLLMWFRVIHLLVSDDKERTASSLTDQLGINYRTARLMLNKLKWALDTKVKFSASRREKEKEKEKVKEKKKEKLELMQEDIKLSEKDGKHVVEKEVTQASEWAKLIHKLNETCTAIQKEKQRMNKMSRAPYAALGSKGNSPSELVTHWMRAFLSISLYPSLMRYWLN